MTQSDTTPSDSTTPDSTPPDTPQSESTRPDTPQSDTTPSDSTRPHRVVVAAAQATPCFMDRDATVDKACEWIAAARKEGAAIVVFPESFVPGYPDWVWALSPGDGDAHAAAYGLLMDNALELESRALDRLSEAAAAAGTYVVMGATLRDTSYSRTSLHNALLFIDAQGALQGVHRKLIPTGGERLVWARGDGSSLTVHASPAGPLGGLICWENYMPLARHALYAQGELIHAAPTWDRGQPWTATLRHIAAEGRVVVIGCCMPLRLSDIPAETGLRDAYPPDTDWINHGGSCVVAPGGKILAGPLEKDEGLVVAAVDLARARGSRWMLDVAGHYGRPDVFQLTVDRRKQAPIGWADAPAEAVDTPAAPGQQTGNTTSSAPPAREAGAGRGSA